MKITNFLTKVRELEADRKHRNYVRICHRLKVVPMFVEGKTYQKWYIFVLRQGIWKICEHLTRVLNNCKKRYFSCASSNKHPKKTVDWQALAAATAKRGAIHGR